MYSFMPPLTDMVYSLDGWFEANLFGTPVLHYDLPDTTTYSGPLSISLPSPSLEQDDPGSTLLSAGADKELSFLFFNWQTGIYQPQCPDELHAAQTDRAMGSQGIAFKGDHSSLCHGGGESPSPSFAAVPPRDTPRWKSINDSKGVGVMYSGAAKKKKSATTPPGRYQCLVKGCTLNYSDCKGRTRHMRKHFLEPWVCPNNSCGARFARSDLLLKHLKRKVPNEETMPCSRFLAQTPRTLWGKLDLGIYKIDSDTPWLTDEGLKRCRSPPTYDRGPTAKAIREQKLMLKNMVEE